MSAEDRCGDLTHHGRYPSLRDGYYTCGCRVPSPSGSTPDEDDEDVPNVHAGVRALLSMVWTGKVPVTDRIWRECVAKKLDRPDPGLWMRSSDPDEQWERGFASGEKWITSGFRTKLEKMTEMLNRAERRIERQRDRQIESRLGKSDPREST